MSSIFTRHRLVCRTGFHLTSVRRLRFENDPSPGDRGGRGRLAHRGHDTQAQRRAVRRLAGHGRGVASIAAGFDLTGPGAIDWLDAVPAAGRKRSSLFMDWLAAAED